MFRKPVSESTKKKEKNKRFNNRRALKKSKKIHKVPFIPMAEPAKSELKENLPEIIMI
jgi:hypothetical protein